MSKCKVTIYKVYDKDGNMVFRGSGREVANKFYTTYATVWRVAKGIQKTYLGQYMIVEESEKEWREI